MHTINAIIFDLGGVILNIDYQKTISAFKALGVRNFDEHYSQLKQSQIFDLFETGKSDEGEFYDEICTLAGVQINKNDFWNAWNAMLLDLPGHRLSFLRRIAKIYPIYLLSNTNEVHISAFNRQLQSAHSIPHLGTIFNKAYFSSEIGLRKPDPMVFEYVMEENRLQAETTLFIDDTSIHIAAAQGLGMHTLHLPSNSEVEPALIQWLEQHHQTTQG